MDNIGIYFDKIIPYNCKIILNILHNKGYEAYIVGGSIRDFIINLKFKEDKIVNDFDIITNAKPEDVTNIFNKMLTVKKDFRTINKKSTVYPSNINNGTVTIIIEREKFEVTTYHTGYKLYQGIKYCKTLKEDISNRDFTMNSMAYNNKNIINYYNGIEDINDRKIKCVEDADEKIIQNPFNIFRAIRFSCQLDFIIEKNTYEAIQRNLYTIKNVSMVKIKEELLKMLKSKYVKNIEYLFSLDILKTILNYDVKYITDDTIKQIQNEEDVYKQIYILFSNIMNDLDMEKNLRILNFGKKDIELILKK